MAIQQKRIIINIYGKASGLLLATWDDFEFMGFSKELNGGSGECILKLARAFDYGGIDVVLGNDVEIRISDKDTVNNTEYPDSVRTIYRGYISLLERGVSEKSESIIVHILGYYTLLSVDILKNAAQTTLYSKAVDGITTVSGDQSAADIGLMMRKILDRYIAENLGPKISYDAGDIPDTGTTAKYTFEQKSYREVMDNLKRLAPAGVYWYVDENGKVSFKASPTTPTHKFVFGKHFNSVRVENSLEKVRNSFLVWNGEPTGVLDIYKNYEDAESIARYGRRTEPQNDYGIGDEDAADAIGAKLLSDNKQAEVKVRCVIMDNNLSENFGYDIESIRPGDTCSFYGFSSQLSDIFRDNMLITRVIYMTDRVEIEVEAVKSGLLDFQEKQSRAITDLSSRALEIPESYS